jgi:stage V sporulation protein D (sporulation-specific penicillin-binding protein)
LKTQKLLATRGLIILALLVVAGFLSLSGRLAYLQLVKGEEYKAKAEAQQLSDTVIKAQRGTIYDRNMKVLAQSASVWLVYINPSKIKTEATKQLVIDGLSQILEVNPETIKKKAERTHVGYELIKGQIEKPVMEEVLKFIQQNKLTGIVNIDPDTKRYYPYSGFAATVLGFTGKDDIGRAGLEYLYNDILTGTAGRVVTAKDGRLEAMPNQYESTYDAIPGTNLVLTIDEVVQYYLESALNHSLQETKAKNVYGIVMDVKTGAILAMANLPDFDPNNPDLILDENVRKQIESIQDEKERNEALLNAKYAQWRNRTISDSYEPGSVFKVVTVSAAVEEGLVNNNFGYTCTGSIAVADRIIRCWKHGGHGSQRLPDLLKNSCNPFAVTIAKLVGTEKYYEYFEAFGLTEKTGIDLPGEAAPNEGVTYHSKKNFGISQLSSYSFGQSFQVTPIQMITAISAVANGGKLMQPYVVAKEIDAEGKVIKEISPIVKRQVISEKTAAIIREHLEAVVTSGTGKNAYVAGYHVAGKTGTSQKLGKDGAYVASFVGFAPANDPKVAVLVAIDEPVGEHGGGAVAAPVAGEIFDQVLPYLNIEPQYSDNELALLVSYAPNVVSKSVNEAKNEITRAGFTARVIGSGDTVVAQSPESDRAIPKKGVVVLYTESKNTSQEAVVPDFKGMTVSAANKAAINNGLNVKIAGSSLNSGEVFAYRQSIAPGEKVPLGTVVTVYFKSNVDVSDSDE